MSTLIGYGATRLYHALPLYSQVTNTVSTRVSGGKRGFWQLGSIQELVTVKPNGGHILWGNWSAPHPCIEVLTLF